MRKVFVAGGSQIVRGVNSINFNSTELYDPLLNTWTTVTSMNTARCLHTATILSNGKVFVAGGSNDRPLNSTELYDPLFNTWTTLSSMSTARSSVTQQRYYQMDRVLVAGGSNGDYLRSAELYDAF